MLTSHAKRIFSDNVTCFWTNNSCSNRSHLPQCFIKALRFLLAWLLCFYMENPRIFFWKAIFATSPIVPAVTIHNLPWKMRVETCSLSFQYGILPSSLCLEARSLCVVCGLLAMLRKKLEVTAFRSFKTLRKHPYNSYHWGYRTSKSCVNRFSCRTSLRQLPLRHGPLCSTDLAKILASKT